MEFLRKAPSAPQRLAVFPGTFNPVTVAHVAVAHAAMAHVDEVVFVLPRVFPHKDYTGASFDDRVAMLRAAANHFAFSIATADGGLFLDIARECRAGYGDGVRLSFLCGRDAAERIMAWDYDRSGAAAEMLREFDLLVAARKGEYRAPVEVASSVRCLEVPGLDNVSATAVRRLAAAGESWEHLVPEAAHELARRIYTQSPERTDYPVRYPA